MAKIQIITEEILGKSKNVIQGGTDIFNSQNNIIKIVQNLGKDFSGKMPSLMTSNLLSMREKHKAMNDTLNNYGDFLKHAAETYEWNDKELAKMANSNLGANLSKKDPGWRDNIATQPGTGTTPGGTGETGTTPATGGGTLKDVSHYRDNYAQHGGNCKAFVNAVMKNEFGVTVPATAGNLYEIQGSTPIANGQVVYNPSAPLTEADVKNLFSNAKPGDVVQMRWTYGEQIEHTAIFNGFDDNGNVLFLEANVDPSGHQQPNVSVHSYSYERIKGFLSHSGNGASIYHMG